MSERKNTFKLPPTTIRDATLTQEARRSKALEEQKLRRAQKFDSARQLDIFSELTLSDEDAEDEEPTAMSPSTGIGSFVPIMKETHSEPANSHPKTGLSTGSKVTGKKKRRRRGVRVANKPSKWADKCMYAELLEMIDPGDLLFNVAVNGPSKEGAVHNDGLPKDLESGWVAITPVPVGKRCLAVTYQSSGAAGVAPNTTLRSRLLGKTLIARFPSALPPLTILDCVLDANWKENGVLHVLDVIKWKGQDVGDCEARFRFWWRDTRLAEIAQNVPSAAGHQATIPLPMVVVPTHSTTLTVNSSRYQFTYPITFLPIPYFTNTSLSALKEQIIPFTREARKVVVNIPVTAQATSEDSCEPGMEIDATALSTRTQSQLQMNSTKLDHQPLPLAFAQNFVNNSTEHLLTTVSSIQADAYIQPDGMLLYVAEASYEAGTSPLSSWIPIVGYERCHQAGEVKGEVKGTVKRERECLKDARLEAKGGIGPLARMKEEEGGPLDLFEQLVTQRLNQKPMMEYHNEVVDMDI